MGDVAFYKGFKGCTNSSKCLNQPQITIFLCSIVDEPSCNILHIYIHSMQLSAIKSSTANHKTWKMSLHPQCDVYYQAAFSRPRPDSITRESIASSHPDKLYRTHRNPSFLPSFLLLLSATMGAAPEVANAARKCRRAAARARLSDRLDDCQSPNLQKMYKLSQPTHLV